MDRREFISIVGMSLLATPRAAGPQTKIPKIGVLSLNFPNQSDCVNAVRRGLNEMGYVEGQTHVFELRWAKDQSSMALHISVSAR